LLQLKLLRIGGEQGKTIILTEKLLFFPYSPPIYNQQSKRKNLFI
jgi:hypothetical protein